MRVLVYKIPAEQALRQNVKPMREGEVLAWNSNGTAIVQFEDLTLDCIDVAKLQGADPMPWLTTADDEPEPAALEPVVDMSKTTGVDKTPTITAKVTGNKK